MNRGYFLIALGERYIDECWVLSNTIRQQGDNKPISLLVHETDIPYAQSFKRFDQFVKFEPSGTLWESCVTSFEKYCLYPRICLNDYLPYEENITIDSDVICQYSSDKVWEFCSHRKLPVTMLGRHNDPDWHWGKIDLVSKAFGKHVPHVHGGFFYVRKKDQFVRDFFDYSKEVFNRYDEYNCQRMFRGGRVDEILFAVTHSHFNIMPIEFDEFPIMTFNYTPDIQIPSKLQTEGNKIVELSDYIPFVHMFDKLEGRNFQSLYNKVVK